MGKNIYALEQTKKIIFFISKNMQEKNKNKKKQIKFKYKKRKIKQNNKTLKIKQNKT